MDARLLLSIRQAGGHAAKSNYKLSTLIKHSRYDTNVIGAFGFVFYLVATPLYYPY